MEIGRRVRQALGGHGYNWLGFTALLVGIAAMGGTSRPDSVLQAGVRLLCVAALIGWMLARKRLVRTGLTVPAVFLGAALLVVAAQLVPLPPGLWPALPGRTFYLTSATVAGLPQPWRPLSLAPDRGLAALFSLLVPCAILAGMARLRPRERATLIAPFAVLILLSAVIGLGQLSLGQESWLRWYRYSNDRSPTGFFANRNHQALFLSSLLPLAAAWARQATQQRRVWTRGWTALGIGVLIVLVIPTTGSRAGLVLGVFGLVAALAIVAPTLRERVAGLSRQRRRRVRIAAIAGAAGFVAVAVLFGRNEAVRRLMDLDSADDLRAQTFPVVWRMVGEFFPAGIGFGSFDAVFRRFEPFEMLSTSYLNQAHNDILQLVLEGGLPAAAVALCFVGWWFRASLTVWRMAPSARVLTGRAASAIVAMTILASGVDYPLRTPLLLAFFATAVCWLATAVATDPDPGRDTAPS